MRTLFISFLFFLYLYPFALKVFPIGTRSFLAVAGILLFFVKSLYGYKTTRVSSKLVVLLLAMLPFVMMSEMLFYI